MELREIISVLLIVATSSIAWISSEYSFSSYDPMRQMSIKQGFGKGKEKIPSAGGAGGRIRDGYYDVRTLKGERKQI